MILELAHNISVIWPNQLQNRTQRNAHARVYTNKICLVINQWNWGWAERHVSPRPTPPTPPPRPIVQIALWSRGLLPDRARRSRDIFRVSGRVRVNV